MIKNQKYAGAVLQFIWGMLAVIQNELKAEIGTGDARIHAKASKAMDRFKVAHAAIDELYRANPYNHGEIEKPAGFEGEVFVPADIESRIKTILDSITQTEQPIVPAGAGLLSANRDVTAFEPVELVGLPLSELERIRESLRHQLFDLSEIIAREKALAK
ncbi:MAG: hypothetical protein ACK506_18975 [Pirellula sp.]|jgi:hypothetical protein